MKRKRSVVDWGEKRHNCWMFAKGGSWRVVAGGWTNKRWADMMGNGLCRFQVGVEADMDG